MPKLYKHSTLITSLKQFIQVLLLKVFACYENTLLLFEQIRREQLAENLSVICDNYSELNCSISLKTDAVDQPFCYSAFNKSTVPKNVFIYNILI
jgi:hypothetical protein